MKREDRLIIGFCNIGNGDTASLIVATNTGSHMGIVNSFTGQEAVDLYRKLTVASEEAITKNTVPIISGDPCIGRNYYDIKNCGSLRPTSPLIPTDRTSAGVIIESKYIPNPMDDSRLH